MIARPIAAQPNKRGAYVPKYIEEKVRLEEKRKQIEADRVRALRELEAETAALEPLRAEENEIELVEAKKKILAFGWRPSDLFSKEDLKEFGSGKPRRGISTAKGQPKFRNPDNHAETWPGGSGPKPGWYLAHIDGGKYTESDMLIPGYVAKPRSRPANAHG